MKLSFIRAMVVIAAAIFCVSHASAETCVDCHKKITPAIVTDWELSKHSKTGVDRATCHGDKHTLRMMWPMSVRKVPMSVRPATRTR